MRHPPAIPRLAPAWLWRSRRRRKGEARGTPMSRRFSRLILAGLVLGVFAGLACNPRLSAAGAANVADNLKIITDIFLRLIHMLVGPLVFSSLVSGIANVGAGAQVGRIGLRTVLWFLGASICSLLLGMVMVN